LPYVNGVYFTAPGVAVVVNDQSFQAPPSVGGLGILFIGPTLDGQPNTAISVATPAQAMGAFKGGDGLQAVLNAFNGATKAGGSLSNVWLIDPTPRTQATSTIASAGSVAQIALTTTSYGLIANSSKWQVVAGTTGYTVTEATDFEGPGGQLYPPTSVSNLSLAPVSLYYSGTGTTPTYTVSDSELVLTATTSDVGGSITFTSTTTVQQLVNQINQLTGWNASVTDPNPSDLVQALFDNVTTATAVSTVSTAPTSLTANVTAVVRWFNAENTFFTAVRQAGATSLATASTWTYATGGTTPAVTNSDWQNAYTTAQSVTGVSLVAPVSPAYSIWAMNDAHCAYMTSQGQPRRGYLGDTLAQTLATEQAQVAILNSQFSTVVWPEQNGVDYNGTPTTFAPYLEAAAIMGERAATPPYDSLAQHPVPSNGMGQPVTPGMVAQGLASGVAIIAPNQQGIPVLQQDRTTWVQNTAYDKVENSTGLVVGIVTTDLLQTLQPFIGKPVSNVTVAQAQSAVFARLNYWYAQNFLATQPKMSDVALVGSGTTITGTAQAAFALPTNYIALQLYPVALGT
jgi:hypothetical protein